jgi:hypothetical protein
VPANKVNGDRLYRSLDRLLPHKEELEKHLKNRLGELFDLDYNLLLYDVTSTYFAGEAERNELAQRGYSRDHRPDGKQVNIALVVGREGMPLGYQLFTGNPNDGTTLEERTVSGFRKLSIWDAIPPRGRKTLHHTILDEILENAWSPAANDGIRVA